MTSAKPIKLYLEADQRLRMGDKEQAARKLAQSMGCNEPSPLIMSSVEKLMSYGSTPNDIVLKIISSEVARNKKGDLN